MKIEVYCSTRFEGFHCWPDAPEVVGFLRDRHRHIFYVKAHKKVSHDDRDVEFILLKRDVEAHIRLALAEQDTANWSCERWAMFLIEACGLCRCEVSEDGENGAIVEI